MIDSNPCPSNRSTTQITDESKKQIYQLRYSEIATITTPKRQIKKNNARVSTSTNSTCRKNK